MLHQHARVLPFSSEDDAVWIGWTIDGRAEASRCATRTIATAQNVPFAIERGHDTFVTVPHAFHASERVVDGIRIAARDSQ